MEPPTASTTASWVRDPDSSAPAGESSGTLGAVPTAPTRATAADTESPTTAWTSTGVGHIDPAGEQSHEDSPVREMRPNTAPIPPEPTATPVHVGVGSPKPPAATNWPRSSSTEPANPTTATGSYDWDAATAAALNDEPAAPDAAAPPHEHTPTTADRLLEDIIREIVGDAAAETASSLQPERPRPDSATGGPEDEGGRAPRGPGLTTEPTFESTSTSPTAPRPTAATVGPAAGGDGSVPSTTSAIAPIAVPREVPREAASAPTDPPGQLAAGSGAPDAGAVTHETEELTPAPSPSNLTGEPRGHGSTAATGSLDERVPTNRGTYDDTIAPRFAHGSTEMIAPPIQPASAGVSRETVELAPEVPVSRETDTRHGGTPLADQLADETRRRLALDEEVLPLPASTRILTISNQKGGVGKTTTAVNLAAALARTGAHVLVIDLDPQGNASTALGVDHRSEQESVYDVLVSDLPLADVVRPSTEHEHLDCVPATIHLAGAEIELVSLVAREQRLRRALDAHLASMDRPYDYVFIDCPPSLGLLTINAFVAAREVLIPIQCEYYALEGLSQLLSNIELIEKHLNSELRLSTILLTMYDSRTNLAQQVAQEVRDHFPNQTLDTIIPRSVRVSEAPSYGQSVISYDYASSGSLSYREAAAEIARRGAATQKDTN
ncbi:chromosome partitioning protein [Agromyces ramosus]|uniref:Chromosome partitioning protein n=2 Tax=Agromyces ramosus TaxID=33879 RepID=A0A4Q7M8S4_9MICO|nr:chromosome partitioning protein [Agromyces ramosus]